MCIEKSYVSPNTHNYTFVNVTFHLNVRHKDLFFIFLFFYFKHLKKRRSEHKVTVTGWKSFLLILTSDFDLVRLDLRSVEPFFIFPETSSNTHNKNTWQEHTVKCTVQISTHNSAQSLVSLAKWLSVRLRTKWLWVRVQLQSLNHQTYFGSPRTSSPHIRYAASSVIASSEP